MISYVYHLLLFLLFSFQYQLLFPLGDVFPPISFFVLRHQFSLKQNTHTHTHTHTHTRLTAFSGTIQVSRYQKGKTNLDFSEARDSEWQWHQLGHYASLHLAPDR